MKIAVAGGTGVVGQLVVESARSAGHDVCSLARSTGVNLLDDAAVIGAVAGCEAIIDVSNSRSLQRESATKFFTTVTRNLQRAANVAGVGHLVSLSIVGLERASMYGYYAAKLAQEEAVRSGDAGATILRATQFHEFAGQIMNRLHVGPVALVPSMPIQSVSARAVAARLVEVAVGSPQATTIEIAGPNVATLSGQARKVARRVGHPRFVLPLRVVGSLGRAVRAGALLATDATNIVGPNFEDWLEFAFPRSPRT